LQQLKPLTPLHLKPSPQLRVAPAQLVCREGHRRLCCCWFRGAGALQLAGPPGLPHLLVPTYVCTSGEHLTCHNNLTSARVLPGCCEQHCNLGAVPRAPILQAEDGRDQADQAHPPGRACPRPGACRGPCPRPDAGSAAQARRGAVARVSHRAVRPSCTGGSLPRSGWHQRQYRAAPPLPPLGGPDIDMSQYHFSCCCIPPCCCCRSCRCRQRQLAQYDRPTAIAFMAMQAAAAWRMWSTQAVKPWQVCAVLAGAGAGCSRCAFLAGADCSPPWPLAGTPMGTALPPTSFAACPHPHPHTPSVDPLICRRCTQHGCCQC
jgi:hypothetical protein